MERHKHNAIKQLKNRPSAPGATADDGAILTIVFLALFAEGSGDRQAYHLHLGQVRAMVTGWGGLSHLQAETAVQAAVAQSVAYGRIIPFPPADLMVSLHAEAPAAGVVGPRRRCIYTPMPFTKDHLSALDLLPSGFRDVAFTGTFSNQTISIIVRAAGNDAPSFLLNTEVYPPSYFRDYPDACPALTIPDGPNGPSLEKLTCLALIRHCFNITFPERPRACLSHCLNIELLHKLPIVPVSTVAAQRECLLWVWLMSVDSWSYHGANLSLEGANLLYQITEKFPETATWTPSDFDKLGTKFFWTRGISKVVRDYWAKKELLQLPALAVTKHTH